MYVLEIQKQKLFMQHLLMESTFHDWLLREASVTTYAHFYVDGTLQPDYFSRKEAEALHGRTCAYWKTVQPYCLSLIRGSRTPSAFHFVFQPSRARQEAFLQAAGLSQDGSEPYTFSLNCRFREGRLILTAGTSCASFSLDRSHEQVWDGYAKAWLSRLDIE